ncbi:MAG: DUF2628 domain-containing protein [Ruminococcaceae bacterium]|nr:DUF2628 domain-containing protein [Oscillospiraceae bacterium]
MDYKGHVCPVCNKAFESGDDVVVCPECGTPHHRECYDSLGQCINQNRHRENYNYNREREVNADAEADIMCPFCKVQNPYDSKFCKSCGRPLTFSSYSDNKTNETDDSENHNQEAAPFGTPFVFDPLGGVSPDEEFDCSVKASEASKLVKTSTPHYIPQFRQYHKIGRTRFSFVGFIFGGGWVLYRKMYKLGTLLTVLMGLLALGDMYIRVCFSTDVTVISQQYSEIMNNMSEKYAYNFYTAFSDFFSSLNQQQVIICIITLAITFLTLLIRVLCGVFGNRWYYKHTIKTVSSIKAQSKDNKEADEALKSRGGVNVPLALSLIASYYIITYLPMFF